MGDDVKSNIKTAIVLVAVIASFVGGLNYVFSTLESNTAIQTDTDGNAISIMDKSGFKQAPTLTGIADFINIESEELQKEIDGKVVLYDIWTYTCINCIRTLPYITAWNDKYADDGLLIIGIHSPEFEFEKDSDNVQVAVEKYGITYPVVLDNDKEIWNDFQNRYWPHKFIADHEGFLRYDHIGEGGYDETEKVIQELLDERAASLDLNIVSAGSLVDIEEFEHTRFKTPELYFGYKFAAGRNHLGNTPNFTPEIEIAFKFPGEIKQNFFYLDGTWKSLEGSMRLISDEGSILLAYSAKEVNIVTENEATLRIYIDGEIIDPSIAGVDVDSKGLVLTTDDDLYNIVSSENSEQHTLQIFVDTPGFEIYTFTFG